LGKRKSAEGKTLNICPCQRMYMGGHSFLGRQPKSLRRPQATVQWGQNHIEQSKWNICVEEENKLWNYQNPNEGSRQRMQH
jgi:hypothetical protein